MIRKIIFIREDRFFNKKISIVHDCDQLILNTKTTLNKFRKIGISWENKIRIMKSFLKIQKNGRN